MSEIQPSFILLCFSCYDVLECVLSIASTFTNNLMQLLFVLTCFELMIQPFLTHTINHTSRQGLFELLHDLFPQTYYFYSLCILNKPQLLTYKKSELLNIHRSIAPCLFFGTYFNFEMLISGENYIFFTILQC